ncbi:VPLPA-CTERM-specific exosortase XrtD [Geobacter pickeringii]|uniref:VPLPA-CTERM-specific exosortase XrtD n=1 Tax=Geobacter pickeringii TaxID=345632 RepID=UPI001F01E623|nr:VPLPA-CTERM-specific exosortase XrtD [Geobacter pickeringii]
MTVLSPSRFLKGALYIALCAGIYASAYEWLVTKDWIRDDYSSCFLVPIIVLYLLWEKRAEMFATPSVVTWRGFFMIVPGIVFFWLGELSGEYFTLYLSSWMVFVGILWMHWGWAKLRKAAFPLLFLLGMFPLPNAVNGFLTLKLKLISSRLGVEMMRLYGLSAYREGNVIDVGFTKLQVVDACSGLRYFIPLLMLAALLAYYYRAARWKRALVIISAVPVSVLTNGLRIASVGILYQFWGPMVAEGFFHDFSGWFIFMASIAILLAEMWLLKRFFPEGAVGGPVHSPDSDRVALHPVTPLPAGSPLRGLLMPVQFATAVLLLGTTLAFSQGINFREHVPPSRALDQFPLSVGEWQGTRTSMEQIYLDALKFDSYAMVDYRAPTGKTVSFYTAYYGSQRKGESIHSPSTCLPGSGWAFEESGETRLPFNASDGQPMRVSRAFMKKGDDQELTYYWFPQRGRTLTNIYQLKLYGFWDALTRQRTDGALVRVITPVYRSEPVSAAEARLQAFTRQIEPVLARYIPN